MGNTGREILIGDMMGQEMAKKRKSIALIRFFKPVVNETPIRDMVNKIYSNIQLVLHLRLPAPRLQVLRRWSRQQQQ